MRETFRIMCEDGGWMDGLAVIGGALTGIIGTFLLIGIFG